MPARVRLLVVFIFVFGALLIARMFYLQVIRYGDFKAQAADQHALVEELNAKRGTIYMHDYETQALVPVALSQDLGFVYVVPKEIENVQETVDALVDILELTFDVKEKVEKIGEVDVASVSFLSAEASAKEEGQTPDEEEEVHIVGSELDHLIPVVSEEEGGEETIDDGPTEYERFVERLSNKNDPYEPIKRGVLEERLSLLRERDLPGVYYLREATRLYPEAGIGGHVLGFVGQDENGLPVGQYGIEGYNNDILAGKAGHLETQKDVAGRLVAVGKRSYVPPEDGADIILTIDRTIQFTACRELRQAVLTYEADGGSVIIMDPLTGNILAMCGYPDFYPGAYGEVDSIKVFNNPATFGSYEPGSIFKSITMAAALDSGTVTPSSTFEDTGEVEVGIHTIRNSDRKAHGVVSMTEVLEKSLNTGMTYVVGELGHDKFRDYVNSFGFGTKIGLALNKESSGDVSSLEKQGDIFAITASFGQGITATPIQMVQAYGAIANGGIMMKPRIIQEVRYQDGYVELNEPEQVRRVISGKSSRLLGAMLVSVIENGHARRAGVPGYYLAGKTGTAQVARNGVYSRDETIGSFVGFGPVDDPRFVMLTRIDNPKNEVFSASTAAPLFGDIAEFLLEYLNVAPNRQNR